MEFGLYSRHHPTVELQREFFGSYVITAAYVGSKGNHLMMTVDLNPAVYIAGASTTANQDPRRPLAPNYTDLNTHLSGGNSTHHAAYFILSMSRSGKM
jgi:hypothetical protein